MSDPREVFSGWFNVSRHRQIDPFRDADCVCLAQAHLALMQEEEEGLDLSPGL